MKRSEALKIIYDVICNITYENIAQKYSEKILTKLEKAGMTPPQQMGSCLCSIRAGETCGVCTYKNPEWDSE
jgi:hypothetical protein